MRPLKKLAWASFLDMPAEMFLSRTGEFWTMRGLQLFNVTAILLQVFYRNHSRSLTGMATQDEFDAKITQIIAEWNKAESDIKTAEQIGGKVVFPSIKELRYAGRRVIDAIDQSRKGKLDLAVEYLVDAHFDCCRGRHDAVDATISIMASEMQVILSKVGYDSALKAFPEFSKLNSMVVNSQKLIASSRQDRNQREKIYASVEGVPFNDMVNSYRDFKANEPVMRSLASWERKKSAIKTGTTIVSLILAGFAVWAGWPQIREQIWRKDQTKLTIIEKTNSE